MNIDTPKKAIDMPKGAKYIINALKANGFDAYVVGGCVRDSLMGTLPTDWDITTSARPDDIKKTFSGHKMISIGERHGTIAVNADGCYYEVTTYRIDGVYTDGRRPDEVSFTADIKDDLQRRDFTINAMAYNDEMGLVDYFGGYNDIKSRIIRCVGRPRERFAEDYLRIMRAYRFGAVLGFELAPLCRRAAAALCAKLVDIAPERIRVEFEKILISDNFDKIDMFFKDCGHVLFPEIIAMAACTQENPYHIYDVYTHSLKAMQATEKDITMRLAALYHDTGKPLTKTMDDKGICHFYGHGKVSYEIAKIALAALRFDNATTNRVLTIIKHHEEDFGDTRQSIKAKLSKFGKCAAEDILNFQLADNMAKSNKAIAEKVGRIKMQMATMQDIISSAEPYEIKHLAITGKDVMALLNIGPSVVVGRHLDCLLQQVQKDPSINNYDSLKELLKSHDKL